MRGDDFFVELAARSPFNAVHPRLAQFLKDYLSREKVVRFGRGRVINTQFPPFPSRAFDGFAEQFLGGEAVRKRLYSVTLAVTNRCSFRCWHCYNAGRSGADMPLPVLRRLARELQDLGATMITLTGGEPLLRRDLAQICRAFDDRSCVNLNSTGWGLTATLARELRRCGLFGMGISLDSDVAEEHDRLRGRPGAFRAALDALATARKAGFYPYVVTVARRELLKRERFHRFLRFIRDEGAMEVHLLEPCPIGRLAERKDVVLGPRERKRILDYQAEVARRDDLPVLSTFTYVESAGMFGCGAGLTHLYIDGSGELCPCNFVPLSFGNVTREPLTELLDRMGRHFRHPRCGCVGKTLGPHIPPGVPPAPPGVTEAVCNKHLPRRHATPRFFRLRDAARAEAGRAELREAYDRIHDDYDDFWVVEAGHPVREMVKRLALRGSARVFEAGCGSGFASVLLAERLDKGGGLVAADISAGMLRQARKRARERGFGNITFVHGDALAALRRMSGLDLVFTSWVLGYIPLAPFFSAASGALGRSGRLAFIVHKSDSPREPLEIFSELVARDPDALRKRVAFDFPKDLRDVRGRLRGAGLEPVNLWEGSVTFTYRTPREVLDHLLKSGAGTVFYDAIDPRRRGSFERRFVEALRTRHRGAKAFRVRHDYIACIAR
jgi:MoaA/NifB/PqqE/SkfB family radical SAM enzyme/SAM-dependent methyltransferase